MDEIREGRLPVVEFEHTLIIGFHGETTLDLVEELVKAKETTGGTTFVVLAQRPKPEVEDMFKSSSMNLRGSKVVARTEQENKYIFYSSPY